MPILWGVGCYRDGRAHFRGHGADNALVIKALKQAEQVGATWLHTCAIVLKQDDWAKNFPVEAMPYVPGKEGEIFNLDYWDNLNSRLDKARDLGMGHYVMLYTDDGLRPDRLGIAPDSREEMRLYRYVMARISPYPIVLWDTGIDISEYDPQALWFNLGDNTGIFRVYTDTTVIDGKEYMYAINLAKRAKLPKFTIRGKDVLNFGFQSGPYLGKILQKIAKW